METLGQIAVIVIETVAGMAVSQVVDGIMDKMIGDDYYAECTKAQCVMIGIGKVVISATAGMVIGGSFTRRMFPAAYQPKIKKI